MNELFSGSINVTEILKKAKEKHSAFVKAENGNIYCNIAVWKNEEPDKYGNSLSLQLNSKKELRDQEGKIFIGNAKRFEKKEAKPLSNNDLNDIDDLPF